MANTERKTHQRGVRVVVPRLKQLRQRRGWTQADLADKAEISLRTVENVEGKVMANDGAIERRVSAARVFMVFICFCPEARIKPRTAMTNS